MPLTKGAKLATQRTWPSPSEAMVSRKAAFSVSSRARSTRRASYHHATKSIKKASHGQSRESTVQVDGGVCTCVEATSIRSENTLPQLSPNAGLHLTHPIKPQGNNIQTQGCLVSVRPSEVFSQRRIRGAEGTQINSKGILRQYSARKQSAMTRLGHGGQQKLTKTSARATVKSQVTPNSTSPLPAIAI
jgi:hypothetical protein